MNSKDTAIINCYSKLVQAALLLEEANGYLEEVKTDDFDQLWREITELHSTLGYSIIPNIELPEFGEQIKEMITA